MAECDSKEENTGDYKKIFEMGIEEILDFNDFIDTELFKECLILLAFKGFDVDEIIGKFEGLRPELKKSAFDWILTRGPKINDKTCSSEAVAAKASSKALEPVTFSQVANVYGFEFATFLNENPSFHVRCFHKALPRILSWTSTQYMSTQQNLWDFQTIRTIQIYFFFSKKINPVKVQTISEVKKYIQLGRSDKSVDAFVQMQKGAAMPEPSEQSAVRLKQWLDGVSDGDKVTQIKDFPDWSLVEWVTGTVNPSDCFGCWSSKQLKLFKLSER